MVRSSKSKIHRRAHATDDCRSDCRNRSYVSFRQLLAGLYDGSEPDPVLVLSADGRVRGYVGIHRGRRRHFLLSDGDGG